MQIKEISLQLKKNFDRIILAVIILFLIMMAIKYITLLKEKPVSASDRDFYLKLNISWRPPSEGKSQDAFERFLDKKSSFIFGEKSVVVYRKLIQRNPFSPLEDLVVKPLEIQPFTARIKLGDKFRFKAVYGIGPYKWECQPSHLGTFDGDEFIAETAGDGKITVNDARGYTAATGNISVVTTARAVVKVPTDKRFIYKGSMTIKMPEGLEILAIVEEIASGRTYSRKTGEKISGFTVKEITEDKLMLVNNKTGRELELDRE